VWFLAGVATSTLLIVVIPPLDLVLLLGLLVATILQLVHYRFRNPQVLAMFLGAMAFSLYTLAWVLTIGSPVKGAGMGLTRLVSG
jgi:hypothetical protein